MYIHIQIVFIKEITYNIYNCYTILRIILLNLRIVVKAVNTKKISIESIIQLSITLSVEAL